MALHYEILALASIGHVSCVGFGILIPTNNLFAQPTLKEVLEKAIPDQEEVKNRPEATTEAVKPETTKPKSKPAQTMKTIPQDELNREVPRESIQGFLQAVHKQDFERAAEYLDLRNLPGNVKISLVQNSPVNYISF